MGLGGQAAGAAGPAQSEWISMAWPYAGGAIDCSSAGLVDIGDDAIIGEHLAQQEAPGGVVGGLPKAQASIFPARGSHGADGFRCLATIHGPGSCCRATYRRPPGVPWA